MVVPNFPPNLNSSVLRDRYVGVSLVGRTLEVMGIGKVGTEVARRAKGLEVIDEDALVRALDAGIQIYVKVDCTCSLHLILVNHENVIFTPHLGASTMEAQACE
ncbi:D-3-phosphoglycerate dehydrogenase 1, chloroplastic [Artemisia annua]|uniref:D-3-phosphoglycerate dehydrogenase 1, chloroplastic n=1 Tax=Artemisia annua TaxID=35608 RepID=A0A2U1N7C0_ARTAN|nr:D-3-phosphoglycerate dehydrogenase 1, chloroplastic [Artemisia annua]